MGRKANTLSLKPVPDQGPQLGGGQEVLGRAGAPPLAPPALRSLDPLVLPRVAQSCCQTVFPVGGAGGEGGHRRVVWVQTRQGRDGGDDGHVAGAVGGLCEAGLLYAGSSVPRQVHHGPEGVVQGGSLAVSGRYRGGPRASRMALSFGLPVCLLPVVVSPLPPERTLIALPGCD